MKVTIADIARLANVSKATVSRVINSQPDGVGNEVRQRVIDIIESVGYQPNMIARSLATAKSKELALILPDITNPFFPALVRGVEDYAGRNGYTVFICNTDNNGEKEEQYILSFIEKRVDGMILTTNSKEHPSINRTKSSLKPPMVMLDRQPRNIDCDVVIQGDNVQGGYLATKHLLEQGRTRIAHLAGPRHIEVTINRIEGYRNALEAFGVAFSEELLFYGDFSLEAGHVMTKELLRSGQRFDGVFAGCDVIAMSALQGLRLSGRRIPEDVSVIGFDNISIGAVFEPSLSTVDQHPYEMGRLAVKTLIRMIEGENIANKHIVLQSHLVIRDSSKGVMQT